MLCTVFYLFFSTDRCDQAHLLRNEQELDDARAALERAKEDAVAHGREAAGAAAEARALREALEESREAVLAREAKAHGIEKAVKVTCNMAGERNHSQGGA